MGGEAKYLVEDGVMVGVSTPGTPNSFMCTTEEYSDFILEFDVKVDTFSTRAFRSGVTALKMTGRCWFTDTR
jgi:hypothetical protein